MPTTIFTKNSYLLCCRHGRATCFIYGSGEDAINLGNLFFLFSLCNIVVRNLFFSRKIFFRTWENLTEHFLTFYLNYDFLWSHNVRYYVVMVWYYTVLYNSMFGRLYGLSLLNDNFVVWFDYIILYCNW